LFNVPGDCTFDSNLCGWTNARNGREDVFDWTRNKGVTTSSNTGPSVDHTTGSNKGILVPAVVITHAISNILCHNLKPR